MSKILTPHQRFYLEQVRSSEAVKLESLFDWQCASFGIGGLEHDYKFHPTRGWEFDRALPSLLLAAEIQGGTHGKTVTCHKCHVTVLHQVRGHWYPVRQGMGHSTANGIQRDIEKLNAAQDLGWRVLLLSAEMVTDGSGAVEFKRLIEKLSGPRP